MEYFSLDMGSKPDGFSRSIHNPSQIAKIISFMNQRNTGWHVPALPGESDAHGPISLSIHDGNQKLRYWEIGQNVFVTGYFGKGSFSKTASSEEVNNILRLLDLKPDIFSHLE